MAGVQDRVALVTGGAQGIGEAIATRLAGDGAKVAVLDLNAEAAVATADRISHGAIGIGADVSKAEQVQAAVDRVVASSAACTSWSTTPACCATTCCSRCPRRTGTR